MTKKQIFSGYLAITGLSNSFLATPLSFGIESPLRNQHGNGRQPI
ncbi:hypothetical protein AALA98_07345 [Lachnospiraceae bacterium 45-W7]